MAKKKSKPAGSARATGGAQSTGSGRAPARSGKATKAKALPSVASQLPPATPVQIQAAKKKFEQGILARGEAAPAGEPLPRGATHEIVTPADGSPPVLKRKRYSLR